MPINDLTNPIHLPNGIDTANDNPIAKAEKIVVTGTNETVTEALDAREDDLGNPTSDGQALVSTIAGVRSWVDPATMGTADPRYRSRIGLSNDLVIDASNIATYDGSLLYVNSGFVGTTRTVTINVDLNFHFIDFANFTNSTTAVLNVISGTGGTIDGSVSAVSFSQFEGGRLVDEPNAGGTYHFIFNDLDTNDYADSLAYTNSVLTIGRTGTLSDLTVSIPQSEPLESLFNATGTMLPKGTPVVAFAHTDGSRRMTRATTSNVGHSLGPGLLENYIYGFLTADTFNTNSNTPIRSGVLENFSFSVSNNELNRRIKLGVSGNNYVLSDDTAQVEGDYASFAGFVVDPNQGSSLDDVFISLDWVEQSRASRLDAEVDGKEDGLGNPAADGYLLSSTTAGVRTWVVPGTGGMGFVDTTGTITAGQYPRFTDSDTVEGLDGIPSADVVLDTVLLVADGLISVPNQTAYDTYANRQVQFRRVNPGNGQSRIFQFPQITSRGSGSGFEFVRSGDLFSVWNDPQDARGQTLRIRTHNSGESLSGTVTFIDLAVNEFATFEVPSISLTRWALVERGFVSGSSGVSGQTGTSMDTAQVITPSPFHRLQPWVLDASGETYRSGDVSINSSDMLMDDNIRRHITNAFANANNPVSLIFADDQSRVAFWFAMTGDAALDISGSVNSIRAGLAAAVTHLEATVVNGFDFVTKDPEIDFEIQALTPSGLNDGAFSVEVENAPDLTTIPQLAVNRQIVISGATNPEYNGTHSIHAITSQHIELNTTGTLVVESDSAAKLSLDWFGRVVVATHATRQYNFSLAHEALRTTQAVFTTNTWNPAYDPDTGTEASALDIDYVSANIRPSLLHIQGSATIQDQSGVNHLIKHGSYDEVYFHDNVGANYQNTFSLPGNYRYLYVDTDGIILNAYIDATTDQMTDGEARTITVLAADRSQNHHYSFVFRNEVTGVTENISGGAYAFFIVQRNSQIEFLLYRNSETDRGIRIITPIERVKPWFAAHTTAVEATIANTQPLSMVSFLVIAAQDEDPGFAFGLTSQFVGVPDDSYQMIRVAEYTFEYNVDVQFKGVEGTGLLFVPISLTPYINGVAQVAARASSTLLFSRNGQTGANAPKFQESLFSVIHWQSAINDIIDFRLTFGTFPAGYSISDIEIKDATPRLTIKLGQG